MAAVKDCLPQAFSSRFVRLVAGLLLLMKSFTCQFLYDGSNVSPYTNPLLMNYGFNTYANSGPLPIYGAYGNYQMKPNYGAAHQQSSYPPSYPSECTTYRCQRLTFPVEANLPAFPPLPNAAGSVCLTSYYLYCAAEESFNYSPPSYGYSPNVNTLYSQSSYYRRPTCPAYLCATNVPAATATTGCDPLVCELLE